MLVRVMANFRRTVELQQASDLIISSINETKNFSANNVLPDGLIRDDKNIYAYRLVPVSYTHLLLVMNKLKKLKKFFQMYQGLILQNF